MTDIFVGSKMPTSSGPYVAHYVELYANSKRLILTTIFHDEIQPEGCALKDCPKFGGKIPPSESSQETVA